MIETLFPQLYDQFILKRNYAKSFTGLFIHIIPIISSVTMLRFINVQNNKPIKHLKYTLLFISTTDFIYQKVFGEILRTVG
jgi:hypothetical protein